MLPGHDRDETFGLRTLLHGGSSEDAHHDSSMNSLR